MAKELPFFKFEPGRWENGHIQVCSFEVQGVFINLCAIYWQRLGDLPYNLALHKVCGGNATALDSLCDHQIIKIEGGVILIDFLDEQLAEFENVREVNSKNARLGWEKRRKSDRNATAMRPHSDSNAIREEKIRGEERVNKPDLAFASAFAKVFNKPYPKERGLNGEGQDIDMILAQLDKSRDWLAQAQALRKVYDQEGWSMPTNPATIVNSLTGTDWIERLKDSDPERKAERKANGNITARELPALAPANKPGALEL